MADDKLVFNRIHFEQIDSTNSYLRKNAALLCDNADDCFKAVVVTAENQTSGRGQRGNVWLSQSGVNLLMSILVHPLFLPVGQQFRLSQIVALSLCRDHFVRTQKCFKFFLGYPFVNALNDQDHRTAENRGGNERLFQKGHFR